MSTTEEDWGYPAPGVTTIAAAAEWAQREFQDRPALVEGDRTLSFSEYVEYARAAARGLIAAGVAYGQRAAIWAPNSVDFAALALGTHISGAALVPVNTRYTVREAADILHRSGARVLFTVDSFLSRSYAAALRQFHLENPELLPDLPRIVIIGGTGTDSLAGFLEAGQGVREEELDNRSRAIKEDDTATVLFTSGTTGQPKGAMLGHGALLRSYWTWGGLLGVGPNDRVLLSNPFFHAFGLNVGLLLSLVRGVTAYPMAVFAAPAALDLIEEHRITYYPAPPTVFQSLLADPSLPHRDISSLRIAVTGATSIPPKLIHDMYDILGFDEVFSPYGFTEATGVATLTRQGDSRETVATTAGRAVPGVEVHVLAAGGGQAAPGETGEIAVRGYNVMQGYLGSEAAVIDDDGYLHSGDLGQIDEQGNLRVTGRIKDMFIVGGFNVYPAEVEAVIQSHPAVLSAAVTGIKDDRLGEVGLACVVLRPGQVLDARELTAWCAEHLANFKCPRTIHFVRELPVNASGKILKRDLQGMVAALG